MSLCFSVHNRPDHEVFQVRIKEEITEVVNEVKYLGIIIDKHLKFDSQVKYICNKIKPNLNCFRFIRRNLSHQAAKLHIYMYTYIYIYIYTYTVYIYIYKHAMIFSHLSYCIPSWLQASTTTMKPIVSIYKQAIKIMEQKTIKWHHCRILRKHNLLTFENVIKLSILRLFEMFKQSCVNTFF